MLVDNSRQVMNCTVREREGLGIIFVLKNFRHYLFRTKVTVVTDHQALFYILNKQNVAEKIARWVILFQEFDLKIVHRACTKHKNVDFL